MMGNVLDAGNLLETLRSHTEHHPPKVLTLAMCKELFDLEIARRVRDSVNDPPPCLLDNGVVDCSTVQCGEDG